MGDLAVGLAADCDRPENDVNKIIRANFPNAQKLPFVAFITHDGKYVEGYSGFKRPGDFLEVLKKADATPYLKATPAVQKKLAGFVAKAEKAAKKDAWKTVIRYSVEAEKTTGRCPERKQMAKLMKAARAWAASQFSAAAKSARSSDDTAAARKIVLAVKKKFAGQPEAAEADMGNKALRRLAKIQKIEAGGSAPKGMREKAARDFKDTRWKAVFEKGAAEPDGESDREAQPESDEDDDEDEEEGEDSEIEVG